MFNKPSSAARELSDLPNLSFALVAQLRKLRIRSPAALREVGAENAWLSVQATGALHGMQVLFALEGAIQNVEWRALPTLRRNQLVRFASTHSDHLPAE